MISTAWRGQDRFMAVCLAVKLAINRCDELEGPSSSCVSRNPLGIALSLLHSFALVCLLSLNFQYCSTITDIYNIGSSNNRTGTDVDLPIAEYSFNRFATCLSRLTVCYNVNAAVISADLRLSHSDLPGTCH